MEVTREPNQDRRRLLKIGAGLVAAVGLGTTGIFAFRKFSVAKELVSHYRAAELPLNDPLSSVWGKIAPRVLEVSPQQMVPPYLQSASIKEIRVRSVNNGQDIAFHLEWEDKDGNQAEAIDRFRDAVAIQIPAKEGAVPPFTMGGPEMPVYVLHWKASWQLDVDKGRVQGATDNYPNMFQDVIPDRVFEGEAAKTFYPAAAVGNPYAKAQRSSPVEEIVARGFGTAASLPGEKAMGKGVFSQGRWKVVIGLPMNGGADRPVLSPGKTQNMAFAVWNGGEKNVGGRKHYVAWQPIEVRGKQS